MSVGNDEGPAWLGIGAQRSGTTWFADLLIQHPGVSFGRSGQKELHGLNTSLIRGHDAVVREYVAEFRDLSGKPGEFTPAYLRMPWVPEVARAACRQDVTLIALLRDPVERFASAMRLFLDRQQPRRKHALSDWVRDKGVDATWAGMYATQLEVWARVFPPDQLVVLQYEQVVEDPQDAVSVVWKALGVDSHPITRVDALSRTTVSEGDWSLDTIPGLRERLVDLYRPEMRRLVAEWRIDPSLWSSFA